MLLISSISFSINGLGQNCFVGVNSSFYVDDFPPDLFGSISAGVYKGHLYGGLEFTNRMGYRPTGFQLLGITGRVNFRPNERMFNAFLETHLSTQISGKRQGTPMEKYSFLSIQENSYNDEGYRFLRANFQGTFGLGASLQIERISVESSLGLSIRQWSSYIYQHSEMVNKVFTEGVFLRVGINYHFQLSTKTLD